MSFKLPRFYPILDTSALGKRGLDVMAVARELAEAQVDIVQFRHKGEFDRETFDVAERVGRIVREAGALYFINDRADVALMLDADGVHIGQDDLPPDAVRRVVGQRLLVGYSTHNEEQLRAADREQVDYIALGPIFGTASKENPDPSVGLENLKRLSGIIHKPLVAIGGISRESAQGVFEAGADSAAVISDWLDGDRVGALANWQRA